MKAKDIIDYASNRLLKRSIDIEDGIAWINDCLLTEMGKDALVYGEVVLSDCKPKQRYDLPEDFIAVKAVYDERGDKNTDWTADGTQISFTNKGTYTVKYHRVPAITINKTNVSTTEPDCHPMLHQVIPYYLAYRFLNIDFAADKETEIRYLEFQSKFNERLSETQKQSRFIKVNPWM